MYFLSKYMVNLFLHCTNKIPMFLHRETNLKVRQALTVTSDLGADITKLADFNGNSITIYAAFCVY